jgi:prespore-specific regulator
MKVRQNAWSKENDLLLAETVLKHVREGSTQLKAFDEVGDLLNRTVAACGFRWNAVVRQQYEKELGLARNQRKQHLRLLKKEEKQPTREGLSSNSIQTTITLEKVIAFLQNVEGTEDVKLENERLKRELELLTNQKNVLEKQLHQLEQSNLAMQEDYEALVSIMNRARKLVLLDEDQPAGISFIMDPNGNLEEIAK